LTIPKNSLLYLARFWKESLFFCRSGSSSCGGCSFHCW